MNDKQKLIITTAQQIFAELGFKKVVLDDVAQKLHMTRTALYYYYKNKEDLFHAVFEYELEQYASNLDQITTEKGGTLHSLSLFCAQYVHLKKNFLNMYKLTTSDIHTNIEVFKSFKIVIEDLHTRTIEKILEDDGEISTNIDIQQSARVLSQSLRGLTVISDSKNYDDTLKDMDFLCKVFCRGLKSNNIQSME
jgi:TetR/AcrR family transcriptional regulator